MNVKLRRIREDTRRMFRVLNNCQSSRLALTTSSAYKAWVDTDKEAKKANEKLDADIIRLSNLYLDWTRKINCIS